MGFFNFLKKQLATVIEWQPQQPDVLLWKYPSATDEIKNASKLIIAPGQGCILVYEGQVTDVLDLEGVYDIATDNHPFVTSLLKVAQLFESEHKVGLYFYRKAEVVNQGWGTSSPVKYMDAEYQIPVQLSAFGNFSYRLLDAKKLFTEYAGTQQEYRTEVFRDLIQSRIPQLLSSYLSGSKIPFTRIDSELNGIALEMKSQLEVEFAKLGTVLTDFRVEGNSFDEETESRIGRVADVSADAMAAAKGGLSYYELEKLRALRDAAKNEGGMAGAGIALGAAMNMGKVFHDKIDEVIQPAAGKDPVEQLKTLKLLLDEQIITQEEFDQKKKEYLKQL